MKGKNIFILTSIFILIMSLPAFAHPKKELVPIFMGKVLEISKDEKNNSVRIRAEGYIKGCSVYEEELILIITEDTKYIPDKCVKDENIEKEPEIGDFIFAILNNAMTKSIPPQVTVKAIQVTKVNK